MKRLTYKCLAISVAMLLSICAHQVAAQFTVSGEVTDQNGAPLIGVSIIVKGTTTGTTTNFDGTFELEVPSDEGVLQISYVGYSEVERAVTPTNNVVNVALSTAATALDEVVVTGLATTVKRSNLANSVESINERELTGVTSQATMDGALYGKFKGAEIRANSGAPGGGMSVRLRGVTSIFGDQQPLYVIDGIYVDNSAITLGTNIVSAAAGGGNTSTNQDDASNRIADIDPEDIESIEILKGASAAAIYGSRAAGGVVLINTKRGRAGQTQVRLSQTLGFSQPTQLLGMRQWDQEKVRSIFGDADANKFAQNGLTDYEAELYDHTNFLMTSRLEVSGGNDKTRYLVAGTYKNDDGIVDRTGYEKASVRANVLQKFTDWLELEVTTNYINSKADRGFFNNGNTNTTIGYALAFTRPWENLFPDAEGNYPTNPAVGSNVLETVALVTNREDINRFLGGARVDVNMVTTNEHSLRLSLRGGLDQYTLRTTGVFPQRLSFYRDPSSLSGVSISGSSVNTNTNMSASLVHSWFPSDRFSLRTQAGLTQADFDLNTVITTATGLNGSQTNVDQATNVSGYQNREPQQDKGFFAQTEFNWSDRIIATVGLTADKSSNNGDANKLYYYPKANVALNLHEFDFWSSGSIDNLKLRAAYGEAGRFANFPDRFNAYNGSLIGLNSGLVTSTLRGNTEVGPERQTELEFGTDISFLQNSVALDVTYYIKSVDDLLFQAQIPTSTGFTRQVINAGELENQGLEIGLDLALLRNSDLDWQASFNWWTNTSEITRLDIPAFNLGGFAASLGQYRIQEGKSATQIVGTYNPDDCETADCSDLDPEGDGFRVYGDAEPDFNLSWSNTLRYQGFELSFLWHWKEGGDGVNLTTLLWDLANLTWDYDDTTLDPSGQMVNGDYRKSQWFAGNVHPWIEDAGYIRLREIGLYYTIPRARLGDVASVKVGVSGRNLVNIFDYNSYDPEVSNFGGNVLANSIEVTPFPYSKQFNFHIKASF